MEFSEVIRKRRSVRCFDPAAPPPSVIEEILAEASWAPSGGNLQLWKTVILGPNSVRDFLSQYQQHALDLMLPAIKLALVNGFPGKKGASSLNDSAVRIVTEDLNLFAAPPAFLVFVYRTRAGLLQRLKVLPTCASVVLYRCAQKRGLLERIRFLLFNLTHFRRLLVVDDMVQLMGVSSFTYAITLSAHDRGLATCILGTFSIDQKPIKRYLGLGRRDELIASVAVGVNQAYRDGTAVLVSSRRPVAARWRD